MWMDLNPSSSVHTTSYGILESPKSRTPRRVVSYIYYHDRESRRKLDKSQHAPGESCLTRRLFNEVGDDSPTIRPQDSRPKNIQESRTASSYTHQIANSKDSWGNGLNRLYSLLLLCAVLFRQDCQMLHP